MVEDKKQALKKLFHDYAMVVIVVAGLIITLLVLIGIRFFALVSIGDLSNINPLITSGQNKLAVKDGTSEIVKIPIDEDIAKDKTSNKKSTGGSTNTSSSTGGSSSGNGGSQSNTGTTTSGGGSSGGGSSGTSGGSTPTPIPPVPPVAAFTVGISNNVQRTSVKKGSTDWFGNCTFAHTITFTVTAQNAPGTARAQWKWATLDWGNEFNVPFENGQTAREVTHTWQINEKTNEKEVRLRILSPNAITETYRFMHQC